MPKFSQNLFVMTVDVDGWSSLLSFYGIDHDASQADAQVNIETGVSRLLNLFGKHRIFATFFIAGEMARKHPSMVEIISKKGHEVACHGLFHWKNECLMDRADQQHRIEKATHIIEEITGIRPVGFRAPCLRANKDTLAILSEKGYLYDSSVIPTFIPGYYGYLNPKSKPYRLSLDLSSQREPRMLLEIPVSVNPIVFISLSAAWMRNLGIHWVKFGIKANFFLKNPVVIYVHPRDVLYLPRVKGVPWHLYRNVGFSTIKMLDETIRYAKTLGASFSKAADLAFAFYEKAGIRF